MINTKTAVILAGGRGTRLMEQTKTIPKPMVLLNGKPIIIYILEKLYKEGINKFYILGGYKIDVIFEYFRNNQILKNKTMSFNIQEKNSFIFTNELEFLNNCELEIIDTGLNAGTAERIYSLKDEINENFLITYGDSISDVPVQEIEKLLLSDDETILSLCAVPYYERFGVINLQGNNIKEFLEKAKNNNQFINGGYIISKPDLFEFIDKDDFDFSRDVLEKKFSVNQMKAYVHHGFWKAIDSQRDLEEAEDEIKNVNL